MKKLLAPLVGDAPLVTVIGLCKNAGKTTALRRLMVELGEEGHFSVGAETNIKLTTPDDLKIFKALLALREASPV